MTENSNTAASSSSIIAEGVATEPEFEMVRTMFANDPSGEWLGATITEVSRGAATVEVTVREDMCQGHGTVQGGFLFAIGDVAFAAAAYSMGQPVVGTNISIYYIAPARPGDVVKAEAKVAHQYGRNGIGDVILTVNGEPIAEMKGMSRVVGGKK